MGPVIGQYVVVQSDICAVTCKSSAKCECAFEIVLGLEADDSCSSAILALISRWLGWAGQQVLALVIKRAALSVGLLNRFGMRRKLCTITIVNVGL